MYNRLLISTQALYPKYALNKALSLAFLRLLSNGSHPKAFTITVLRCVEVHVHNRPSCTCTRRVLFQIRSYRLVVTLNEEGGTHGVFRGRNKCMQTAEHNMSREEIFTRETWV
jgi:hypothetical protein